MRRLLVVAHQTLTSPELLAAMSARAEEEQTAFHLVVPLHHGTGMTWTEGRDRAVARQRMEEARALMIDAGLTVTGEVGSDDPADSVIEVIRRHRPTAYAGIIVSMLPSTISRWLRADVPSKIRRRTNLPVEQVLGRPVETTV